MTQNVNWVRETVDHGWLMRRPDQLRWIGHTEAHGGSADFHRVREQAAELELTA